ncbi:MAG: hypothetical protein OXU81_06430, partial [Gammaproteobacteria bacterium]|nr:hypothetical protein [Gammaproteobacteria bacterium]
MFGVVVCLLGIYENRHATTPIDTQPAHPRFTWLRGISKLSLDKYVVPTMKLLCLGHLPMVLIVKFIPGLSLALPRL